MDRYPTFKTWLLFSFLGGVLGSLNLCWYLLNPYYIDSIISRWNFEYVPFAIASAACFVGLLFIPTFLSTMLIYPSFWKMIKETMNEGCLYFFQRVRLGLLLGLIASIPTAFFFFCEALLSNYFYNYNTTNILEILTMGLPGVVLLAFTGFVMGLPGILFSGTLMVFLTEKAISKSDKPHIKRKRVT